MNNTTEKPKSLTLEQEARKASLENQIDLLERQMRDVQQENRNHELALSVNRSFLSKLTNDRANLIRSLFNEEL